MCGERTCICKFVIHATWGSREPGIHARNNNIFISCKNVYTTRRTKTKYDNIKLNQENIAAEQNVEDDPWSTKMFEDIELDEVSFLY